MKLKHIVLGTLLISSIQFAHSAAGTGSSGGGSGAAAEFADFGYNAAKVIANLPSFPVASAQFNTVVNTTHVEFVDQSLTDPSGRQVDALNFPEKGLVKVNLGRWQGMLFSPVSKFQLAVHEYLGILKIDDSGYRVSTLILNGGVTIDSMVCKYSISDAAQGVLTWYVLDTTGTGNPDKSEAQFALQSADGTINIQTPVSIGASSTQSGQMGYNLAWSALILQENAFVSYDNFSKAGNFSVPYYDDAGFDANGAPTYKLGGTMNCTVTLH